MVDSRNRFMFPGTSRSLVIAAASRKASKAWKRRSGLPLQRRAAAWETRASQVRLCASLPASTAFVRSVSAAAVCSRATCALPLASKYSAVIPIAAARTKVMNTTDHTAAARCRLANLAMR